MEFVEPIRDKSQIEAMKSVLKQRSLRDWLLFTLGINSGLRISDLLRLTVEDVAGKDRIVIREQKTGKAKDFPLSKSCKSAIAEYLSHANVSTGALFASRKGSGSITRQQAYEVINNAALACQVITKKNGVRIGTHSLRKSFGFHAYNSGVSIEMIQRLMNHSSPSVTLSYIGITKQAMDSVYIDLDL